jgi:hypothetical protein
VVLGFAAVAARSVALAGYVLVFYAAREVRGIFSPGRPGAQESGEG